MTEEQLYKKLYLKSINSMDETLKKMEKENLSSKNSYKFLLDEILSCEDFYIENVMQ